MNGIPLAAPSARNWLLEHPFKVEGGSGYINFAFWIAVAVAAAFVFKARGNKF